MTQDLDLHAISIFMDLRGYLPAVPLGQFLSLHCNAIQCFCIQTQDGLQVHRSVRYLQDHPCLHAQHLAALAVGAYPASFAKIKLASGSCSKVDRKGEHEGLDR